MKSSFKLLDSVAILKDVPAQGVVYGQVGTIVEVLGGDVFEVEFSDKRGQTISEFALGADDLLLLHHDAVKTN